MNSVPESNVELVLAIKEALWEVQRKGLEVQVHWCTGHMNIYGNELADKFAKEAGFYCPQSLTYKSSAHSPNMAEIREITLKRT